MAETPNFEEMLKELEKAEQKKAEETALKEQKKAEQRRSETKTEDDAVNRFIRDFVTLGTPACGLTGLVIGLALAALLLTIGFWKTLFVAVLGVAGAFVGGIYNKSQWVKDWINRLFPPKQ